MQRSFGRAGRQPGRGEKKTIAREPDDHALGRSRGGFGTKIHLVTDRRGVPLGAVLSAGQAHESKFATAALESVRILRAGRGRPRTRPRVLVGDKGYSIPRVRRDLKQRGITPMIPTRSDQPKILGFSRRIYRGRNAIERCVGWLKENRRLGTRYEKLAVTVHSMTQLAIIRRCFRLIDPSNRT